MLFFRQLILTKNNLPILGIDDAGFVLHDSNWDKVAVFATIMRSWEYTDGILMTEIDIDDSDPTTKIINLIKESKFKDMIRIIMHAGITIGGFGIIDAWKIYYELNKPVIIVLSHIPNYERIKNALNKHFVDGKQRWDIVKSLPEPISVPGTSIYIQNIGIDLDDAINIVKKSTRVGYTPEALRLAHLIGVAYYQHKLGKIADE